MSSSGERPSESDRVQFVLDRFNAMLAENGASLEVASLEAGRLRLRFHQGAAGDCDACVLEPDDLEVLIGEALQLGAPEIQRVEVLR